jgi:hypothetical protein
MAYLNPTAGAAREGGVSTAALDAGVLAASTAGRALMATGFFSAAKASDAFAANALAYDRIAARTVEAHTAGDTLTAAETGSIHTNTGASGAITLVLPSAAVGLEFIFVVGAAQELRIDPNTTQTISLPSTGVAGAAGKYLVADAIGESVHLACSIAGTWAVLGYTGTWSAEA